MPAISKEETVIAQRHAAAALTPTADPSPRRSFPTICGGATAALAVGAQTHAHPPSPASEASGLAEWIAGWEALDARRNAASYDKDAILVAVPTGETVRGRAAIRANIEALFAAFSGATARMPVVLVTGERAAAEWTFAGRYTGHLPGLPPGTGQFVEFRGVSVLELAGGAIRRNTRYFDLFALLAQTGAIPPAPRPTGGVATPES